MKKRIIAVCALILAFLLLAVFLKGTGRITRQVENVLKNENTDSLPDSGDVNFPEPEPDDGDTLFTHKKYLVEGLMFENNYTRDFDFYPVEGETYYLALDGEEVGYFTYDGSDLIEVGTRFGMICIEFRVDDLHRVEETWGADGSTLSIYCYVSEIFGDCLFKDVYLPVEDNSGTMMEPVPEEGVTYYAVVAFYDDREEVLFDCLYVDECLTFGDGDSVDFGYDPERGWFMWDLGINYSVSVYTK